VVEHVNWNDPILAYCERGQDPAFWAEPFNALSNVGFLIVAGGAGMIWFRRPAVHRDRAQAALIGLVGVIGVGSFAFHTLANRVSMIADVVPIGVFMFAYAGVALRQFLGWSWRATVLGVAAFAAMIGLAFAVPCPSAVAGLVAGARCLNGSVGYLPALVMVAVVGAVAAARGHLSGPPMLAAAVVFAGALTARSLDVELCGSSALLGHTRGTHAIWHLLNAVTLALLLRAVLAAPARTVSVPGRG
jgi:hypothetical protein